MIQLLIGAATGVVVTWLLAARRLRALEDTHRSETDRLRAARAELEATLAESRGHADTSKALVEAARAQVETAQTEAEAAKRAAELSTRDATLRAREAIRAEVEGQAKARAEQIIGDARQQASELLAESRARTAENAVREEAINRRETAMVRRDEASTQREQEITRRDKSMADRERALASREAEVQKLVDERRAAAEAAKVLEREALERVASLTAEDARKALIDQISDEARRIGARDAKAIEDLAREEAEKRAKRVIGIAVQRYAGEYAGERAVSSVHLPSDELKGRIIGREGRNIRAFQEVTGCDLVIDDTPETIVVSSFDPVRREMARLTLERLIQDGRIHPTKIEELFAKARDDVDRAVRDAGDQAVMELGIGRLHTDLLKLVGQLRFRYSYAQNVLRHSIEVGHMAGLMAAEMGLNVRQARRAGLLHDIGKAVTHETEGGHAVIGAQMARKAGEDEIVCNAIAAHHDDEPARSVLAHLTAAADAISGARPGARREMLESYVQRLDDLEKICGTFKGVERSFAIQAGREVRVLVEPGEIDDAGALALSRDIARKIEDELAYPGQIRVTVVRETRAVDYAR